MPDYEGQQFDPPAPVARVTIRALDGVRGLPDVAMLIDSGADVTLIPQVCAQRLGLKSEMEASVNLVGIGGTAIAAKAVKAELFSWAATSADGSCSSRGTTGFSAETC